MSGPSDPLGVPLGHKMSPGAYRCGHLSHYRRSAGINNAVGLSPHRGVNYARAVMEPSDEMIHAAIAREILRRERRARTAIVAGIGLAVATVLWIVVWLGGYGSIPRETGAAVASAAMAILVVLSIVLIAHERRCLKVLRDHRAGTARRGHLRCTSRQRPMVFIAVDNAQHRASPWHLPAYWLELMIDGIDGTIIGPTPEANSVVVMLDDPRGDRDPVLLTMTHSRLR